MWPTLAMIIVCGRVSRSCDQELGQPRPGVSPDTSHICSLQRRCRNQRRATVGWEYFAMSADYSLKRRFNWFPDAKVIRDGQVCQQSVLKRTFVWTFVSSSSVDTWRWLGVAVAGGGQIKHSPHRGCCRPQTLFAEPRRVQGTELGGAGEGVHKIVEFIHYFLANKKVTLLP